MSKSTRASSPPSLPFDTQWKPHEYQVHAVKFLLERAAAALFLDPGLGKTSIVLAALKVLKKERLVRRTLVIAPLRVCYSVWPAEIAKWDDFSGLRIEILHGPKKDEALRRDADIYVINPEGLEWLMSGGRMKLLDPDTLVVDESTKFKHTNTRRFKTLKPVLTRFRRRWILTGSPAPNGMMDLFGQIYLLDMGHALGGYISHFRQTFFTPSGFGGFDWVLKPGAEQDIYAVLGPLTLRLSAEDHLDLPPKVENVIWVDLPPKARRVYDELEQELMAILDGGEVVTAVTAAVATMKCRQVANGGLHRQLSGPVAVSSERWAHIHDAKTEALMDLVEELQGQPLLVAYDFEHDRDRLLKALGKDTPYIGGGVSPKKSAEIEAAWNRGEIPVLLGHPQAMGHGLNLQGAGSHVAWYALTWDLELHDQFIRRVWRQGTTGKRIVVHYLLARDTIDIAIMAAIKKKGKVQGALLGALRDYSKTRK